MQTHTRGTPSRARGHALSVAPRTNGDPGADRAGHIPLHRHRYSGPAVGRNGRPRAARRRQPVPRPSPAAAPCDVADAPAAPAPDPGPTGPPTRRPRQAPPASAPRPGALQQHLTERRHPPTPTLSRSPGRPDTSQPRTLGRDYGDASFTGFYLPVTARDLTGWTPCVPPMSEQRRAVLPAKIPVVSPVFLPGARPGLRVLLYAIKQCVPAAASHRLPILVQHLSVCSQKGR